MVYAILTHQPISNVLMDSFRGGIANKVNAARNYAKNTYTLGLPDSSSNTTAVPNAPAVTGAITDSLSLPYGCEVVTAKIVDMGSIVALEPYLYGIRGLIPSYGDLPSTITNLPDDWTIPETIDDKKTYYGDANIDSIVLQSDGVTYQITYKLILSYSIMVDYGADRYPSWVPFNPSLYQDTYVEEYVIPTSLNFGDSYCVARYYELDALGARTGNLSWWYYAMESNVYAILNTEVDANSANPIVPIRYSNRFINQVDDGDLYATGKKLLKMVDVSFDNLVTELDTNPDIADIDNAYVMFGVDLQSDNLSTIKYLIKYYSSLAGYGSNQVTIFDNLSLTLGTGTLDPYSVGVKANDYTSSIADLNLDNLPVLDWSILSFNKDISLIEYGLKINIEYDNITAVESIDSIGPIGTVTKEIFPTKRVETTHFSGVTGTFNDIYYNVNYTTPLLVLKEQISDTRVLTVTVTGPVHKNNVYKDRSVITDLDDVDGSADEHNFIVPLNHGIVQLMDQKDKDELYSNSINLVITGYDDSHVQWYSTTLFQFTVTAVMSVLSLAMPWATPFVTAMTNAGMNVTVAYLLVAVITTASIQVVGLSRVFGKDFAIAVGALSIFTGGIKALASKFALVSAETLMYVGSVVIKTTNAVLNAMLTDVESEYQDWVVDAEAEQEIIDAKIALLEKDHLLDFSYFTSDALYPEPDTDTKPEHFYDKIHIGNIGTLSLGVVESYVERSLALPKDLNLK